MKKPSFCKKQIYMNRDESVDSNSTPSHKRHVSQVLQLSNEEMSTPDKKPSQGDAKSHLYQVRQNSAEICETIDNENYKRNINTHRNSEHYTECICENIDMISLWISPILFIIFSIVYWIVYY